MLKHKTIRINSDIFKNILEVISDKFKRDELPYRLDYGYIDYDDARKMLFEKYEKSSGLVKNAGKPNNCSAFESAIKYYMHKLGYEIVGCIEYSWELNEDLKKTIERIITNCEQCFSGTIDFKTVIDFDVVAKEGLEQKPFESFVTIVHK